MGSSFTLFFLKQGPWSIACLKQQSSSTFISWKRILYKVVSEIQLVLSSINFQGGKPGPDKLGLLIKVEEKSENKM